MREYRWKPIEPLSDAERSIDLADIQPLYESWRAAKQRLEQSSPEGLQRFATRLVRRLSIETGILERLYDLDRGTTEALVTAGFIEDLVARSSTDIEPARIISILSDQEAAIKLVMDCVDRESKAVDRSPGTTLATPRRRYPQRLPRPAYGRPRYLGSASVSRVGASSFPGAARVYLGSLVQGAQVHAFVVKILEIHSPPGLDERHDSTDVFPAVEPDCGSDSALIDVARQKAT